VDIGDSDRFVEKELRPELMEAPCAPAGIALSLRHQPRYDHSYHFISKFMPDPLLGCGEIAKGINDDAQSTRVRSIGRGDGGLAGVGRLGSSVNHRLA
jgi:hypothetical protein